MCDATLRDLADAFTGYAMQKGKIAQCGAPDKNFLNDMAEKFPDGLSERKNDGN